MRTGAGVNNRESGSTGFRIISTWGFMAGWPTLMKGGYKMLALYYAALMPHC